MGNSEIKQTIFADLYVETKGAPKANRIIDYVIDQSSQDKLIYKHYSLISYQRDYKWNNEMCEIFFDDVTSDGKSEYNFGIITLANMDTSAYELIDGQQRVTSCYLLCLAIYKKLFDLGASPDELRIVGNFLNLKNGSSMELIKSVNSKTVKTLNELFNEILSGSFTSLNQNDIVNDNFRLFLELLDKRLLGSNDSVKEQILSKLFRIVLNQNIITMTYSDNSYALDSFIALNMKTEPLDSFEITSALLLKDLDKHTYTFFRDSIDKIKDDFDSKFIEYQYRDFEDYLKNALLSINYESCLKDTSIISQYKFGRISNYVSQELVNARQKRLFLHDLNRFNNVVYNFFNSSTVSNDEIEKVFTSQGRLDYQKRMENIKFLLEGFYFRSNNISKLSVKKIPKPIQRFLFAILWKCHTTSDIDEYFSCLNEIVVTLIIVRLIAVRGYNYSVSRKSAEQSLFKTAFELRILVKSDEDSLQTVMKSVIDKKSGNKILSIGYIDLAELMVLYQVNSLKGKSLAPSSDIICNNLTEAYNQEHFVVDYSRCKVSPFKNCYLFNCLILEKRLNDDMVKNQYKCLIDKVNYLKVSKSLSNLNNAFVDIYNKKLLNLSSNNVSAVFSDSSLILDETCIKEIDYYSLMDCVVNEIDGTIVNYINNFSKNILGYNNNNVVFK